MLWPESPLALIARGVFSGLCHQDAARSFARDGHAMAVCHRCAGIYLGLALGALAALGVRLDAARKSYWLAGIAPLAVQVALGWAFPALDLYWLRVATGLVAGGAGGLLLASAVAGPRKV
ncbi:MAG: DUF2085 domain-containing protein [Sandaracinaceae bacterium]|nr:DUF2085 domain-containing protein [Sandaracinaceae bacterium]